MLKALHIKVLIEFVLNIVGTKEESRPNQVRVIFLNTSVAKPLSVLLLSMGRSHIYAAPRMRILSYLLHFISHISYTKRVHTAYLLHPNGTCSIMKWSIQRFSYTEMVQTAYLLHQKQYPAYFFFYTE